MEETQLQQFHPRVAAVLADLYGIGRPRLSRQQVRIKYRLTYARLDWIMTKVQKMLNDDAQ